MPETASDDSDLATVVRAWPTLPKMIRAGLVALVRSAVDAGAKR